MHLRIYWKKLGGHYHCRVFSAPTKAMTHACNGTLVFDEREWEAAAFNIFSGIAEMIAE